MSLKDTEVLCRVGEFRLTAAVLRAVVAQLRVLVQAHAPQLDHIFGRGGDESEAVTTSSRRNLQQKKRSW